MAEKKKLSAGKIHADIRGGLDAEALMTKYDLSPDALEEILDELEQAGVASRSTTDRIRSSVAPRPTDLAEEPPPTSREASVTKQPDRRGKGATAKRIVVVLVVIALLGGAAIHFGGPYATQMVKGELENAIRISCRQHNIDASWKSSELTFGLKGSVLTLRGLSLFSPRDSVMVKAEKTRFETPLTAILLRPFLQSDTPPSMDRVTIRNARITLGELPGILGAKRIDLTTTSDEPGKSVSDDQGPSEVDGIYVAAHIIGIEFDLEKQLRNSLRSSVKLDKLTKVDSVSISLTYKKNNDTIQVHCFDLQTPEFSMKLKKPIRCRLETGDSVVQGRDGLSRKIAVSPGILEWTSPQMTGTYSFGSLKSDSSMERCVDERGKRTCVLPIGSQTTSVQNFQLKGVKRGKRSGRIDEFLMKSDSADWSWNYDGSKLTVIYNLNKLLVITEKDVPRNSRPAPGGDRASEKIRSKTHMSASKVGLTYDGEIKEEDLKDSNNVFARGNHNFVFSVADCAVVVPTGPPGLSPPLPPALQTASAKRIVFNASLAGADNEGSITGSIQSPLYSGSFEAKALFPKGALSRPDPVPENMTFNVHVETVPEGIAMSEPDFPGNFSLKSLWLEANGGFRCDEKGKPILQTVSGQGRFRLDELNAVISPILALRIAPPGLGIGRDISSRPLSVERLSFSAKLEGDSFKTEEATLASPYFHMDVDAALKLDYGKLEQSRIERFVLTLDKVNQNLRPLLGFFTKSMGGPLEPQGDKLILKASGTVGNPDFGVRPLPSPMIIPRGKSFEKSLPGLKPPPGRYPHFKLPEFPR